MQTYAESLKETLGNYKFYRNSDLYERAGALLDVGGAHPIIMNEEGKVYCMENSLRIFVNDGCSGKELVSSLRLDRRYNFVVVYLEGKADISEMFTELRCNTFTLLVSDDRDEIKAHNVFTKCNIRTLLMSAVTLGSVSDFFVDSNIDNCSIHDITINSLNPGTNCSIFMKDCDVNMLNLGNIMFGCSTQDYCHFVACNFGKLYFTGVGDCCSICTLCTAKNLILDSVKDLFEYYKDSAKNHATLVSVREAIDKSLLSSNDIMSILKLVGVMSFTNCVAINDSVECVNIEGVVLANSYDNVNEMDDKESCRLQCAVHFIKGTKCYTYINPDLSYAYICVPPASEVEVHGPGRLDDLIIEGRGIIPKITYRGELKKSIDKHSCAVHKSDNITICEKVTTSEQGVGTFQTMFSKAISKANPVYTDINNVADSIIHYKVDGNAVIFK